MYFYVDESGNTGNNLFDSNQPRLSYGVLSSRTNPDALGRPLHRQMLKALDAKAVHANQLGIERLTKIAPQLRELQKKMKFDFDVFYIDKPSYALVVFFDAVFDAGLNKAVKWDLYWTPLRYVALHKLSVLFDEQLLREAWNLCISKSIEKERARIVALLKELLARLVNSGLDKRSIELISDALKFGIRNPLDLDFGTRDERFISPNSVCFQFVVSAIAYRLRKKNKIDASSIIVDRQAQFNRSQIKTHYHSKVIAESLRLSGDKKRLEYLSHPLYHDIDSDELLRKGTPQRNLTIRNSDESIGLQITDTYLWIFNRLISESDLSPELYELAKVFSKRTRSDGISLDILAKRFESFEKKLPALEDLTQEQIRLVRKNVEEHRKTVNKLGI